MDELADGRILVAESPPLVDDDAHQNQYHHNDGSGQGDGKDDVCFHTI